MERAPEGRQARRLKNFQYGEHIGLTCHAGSFFACWTAQRGPGAADERDLRTLVGTLRRELLDRVLILSEAHLRAALTEYQAHCNTARPQPDGAELLIEGEGQVAGLLYGPLPGTDTPTSAGLSRLPMDPVGHVGQTLDHQ